MRRSSLNIFSNPTAGWFAEVFGSPTEVQEEAWPAIAEGRPVLVSAPTGTGKTLSAFLVFIDRLMTLARESKLKQQLYVIYVSPLKSLAGDIRENLKRPLEGIGEWEPDKAAGQIRVGLRTGDTPQKERQRMVKQPPHILITTPESLYLMLTSAGGQTILRTAEALIIDELHALIDTKRGAHLMLSVARLDRLCGRKLQRIGLSATIEPLSLAARYLSPEPAVIAAPAMKKQVRIQVLGITPVSDRKSDSVWQELGKEVYSRCTGYKSVLAFTEGRRYAEKLAYYVNEMGGDGFARVHHGSLAKEQRASVEDALRKGELRLLCATSSMELGIDVGDIDQVIQVGCPRTVSGTMQRLGRAGHNPGRVSVMYMYPRTATESLYCGMTAEAARQGGVEEARPPLMCLDVLAQHLVSMAGGKKRQAIKSGEKKRQAIKPGGENGIMAVRKTADREEVPGGSMAVEPAYTVQDVMDILKRTYTFRNVTREDVKDILSMLAGDYEHRREIAVRPRVIYDRLHEQVFPDSYSRMLAVAAGGTIPDKGLYTAKTREGVKVGELDEEFVYETQLGDRFVLGSFTWKIVGQDKDSVIVTQAPAEGARLPFWKGEIKGRDLKTARFFGRLLRSLSEAETRGQLENALEKLGLDETAREGAAGFLRKQMNATGGLPDDRTIIAEHFTDSTGSHQLMVHSLFGKRVNAPLSLLMQHTARTVKGMNVGCVEEEDGFLLYPYGEDIIPDGLLFAIDRENAEEILEAVLPVTPVFGMTFRYNSARALMMGMKQGGRQPLWMQRLRSTEMLDSLVQEKRHPLIRETRRECLEDFWDIQGLMEILEDIHSGRIIVRELYVDTPSPMCLPLQWQAEAAEMYEYTPATPGIRQAVYDELKMMDKVRPTEQELKMTQNKGRLPQDELQLHSLLMMEGDLAAGELEERWDCHVVRQPGGEEERTGCEDLCGMDACSRKNPAAEISGMLGGWLEKLAEQGMAAYIEPGLWIAAEQKEEYTQALEELKEEAGCGIIRRFLYYRGARTAGQIQARYDLTAEHTQTLLEALREVGSAVEDGGVWYHAKWYDRARKAYIKKMRMDVVTRPPEAYAALMGESISVSAPPAEQLKRALLSLSGRAFAAGLWENVIFPGRVRNYNEALLDRILAEGDFFWRFHSDGSLFFVHFDDIDWDAPLPEAPFNGEKLSGDELTVWQELKKRGASFVKTLSRLPVEGDVQDILLELAQKGLACADSFVPVRRMLNRDKLKKATVRQRVNVRVTALSAGRWDVVRPLCRKSMDEQLKFFLRENMVLCRETFRSFAGTYAGLSGEEISWGSVLERLGIWEYTGRARRGYFISGMSGAQFIGSGEYESVVRSLGLLQEDIIWLNASDPAQIWGKALEHGVNCSFINVPGTAVALCGGRPAAVMERQGRTLRLFREERLTEILSSFVNAFREKRLFPDKKRLVLKEYPGYAGEFLKQAGFAREMMDYVLYR